MDYNYLLSAIFSNNPIEGKADAVMDREDFREYVSVNGYHFSDKLASCAISHMVNLDGTSHKWCVSDSASILGQPPKGWTVGDAAFALNRLYRDTHIKDGLASEQDVIAYARNYMQSTDNRNGSEFVKWISEIVCNGDIVEWYKFN